MQSVGRAIAALWVEALDPAVLEQGYSGTVTVTGYGFLPTTVIEFLELDGETLNDDITVTSITFVDTETLTLAVTVAADAELDIDPMTGDPYALPIAYDNPGAPL
jgi:hypothetical protein